MDFHATVVKWLDDRGYGFIRLPDGRDVFCHCCTLAQAGLGSALPVGREVEVDIETAPDGRLRVARIRAAFAGPQLSEAMAIEHRTGGRDGR
jgi:cold shock CspA family protein